MASVFQNKLQYANVDIRSCKNQSLEVCNSHVSLEIIKYSGKPSWKRCFFCNFVSFKCGFNSCKDESLPRTLDYSCHWAVLHPVNRLLTQFQKLAKLDWDFAMRLTLKISKNDRNCRRNDGFSRFPEAVSRRVRLIIVVARFKHLLRRW